MKKEDEIIYKLLGTTNAPSENRKNLAKKIKLYLQACDKVEVAQLFIKYLQNFFHYYPEVNSIEFIIETSLMGDYNISFLEFSCLNSVEQEQLKKSFYFIVFDIGGLLHYLSEKNRHLTIKKYELNRISRDILHSDELEIFNRIENFEKHKLEENIPVNNEKEQPLKV